MATQAEITTEILRLVNGETALDAFEDWFLASTWEQDTLFIRRVMALLAESAGNGDDDLAVRALAKLMTETVITVPLRFAEVRPSGSKLTVVTGSDAATVVPDAGVWSAESGSPARAVITGEPVAAIEKSIEWGLNITRRMEEYRVPVETRN